MSGPRLGRGGDLHRPREAPPGVVIDAAGGMDWSAAAGRGLAPGALAQEFAPYVESGARTVRAEVILTTCEELLESEFGRSIHGQRILEQRHSLPYSGRIANNASFLTEYLLMLAISPRVEVTRLPVQMWGRYLPDIYALAVWDLFGIHLGLDLVPAFADATEALLHPPGSPALTRPGPGPPRIHDQVGGAEADPPAPRSLRRGPYRAGQSPSRIL